MLLNKKLTLAMAGMLAATNVAAAAAPAGQQTTTIPVTLTVVNSINSIDVTLPASFPVGVMDGKVLTATNVDIRNNSTKNKVEVTDIRVTDGAYKVVNYESFPNNDKGKIAMSLNGCATTGSGALAISKTAFPVIGEGETLPINYKAKVAATGATRKLNAANVIITLKAVKS